MNLVFAKSAYGAFRFKKTVDAPYSNDYYLRTGPVKS
jgi:hypothetical protein